MTARQHMDCFSGEFTPCVLNDPACPMKPDYRTCRFCERTIVYSATEEEWICTEAPQTPEEGDDYIWRSYCPDNDESRVGEHSPRDENDLPDEDPLAEDRDRERHL